VPVLRGGSLADRTTVREGRLECDEALFHGGTEVTLHLFQALDFSPCRCDLRICGLGDGVRFVASLRDDGCGLLFCAAPDIPRVGTCREHRVAQIPCAFLMFCDGGLRRPQLTPKPGNFFLDGREGSLGDEHV
jgi:hypothetical protein